MANITEMTSNNIFYKARIAASVVNEPLGSRDNAADMMSIDRGRLYRIERGVAAPYPEEVDMMADLYNAPELRNHFCTTMCPLGCDIPKAEAGDLDRISIRTLVTLRKVEETKELLLDITADGAVSEDEKADMQKILGTLEEMEQAAQSLKLWVKKNL